MSKPTVLPIKTTQQILPALRGHIDAYFDFQAESIDVALAFHLFNDSNPLPPDGLAGLRGLDHRNLQLALPSLRLAATGRAS